MFNHQYVSAQYFPPVWFAPGDEYHLLPEERSQEGGIGHGSKSKKKKRWIEREGKILVFDTPEDVDRFIKSESKDITVKAKKKSVKQNTQKPVEIIDKQEIKSLSIAYNYRQTLYYADQIGDIDRIIKIYRELQKREEEDIELLLIAS